MKTIQASTNDAGCMESDFINNGKLHNLISNMSKKYAKNPPLFVPSWQFVSLFCAHQVVGKIVLLPSLDIFAATMFCGNEL
jgi:hypothetical protein